LTKTIRARYHEGRLELLEPLDVEEGTEVTVTVDHPEPSTAATDPLTASAGGWKELLDCEQFEKDVARQQDLERVGWRFVRIRESEFYLDPEAALRQDPPRLPGEGTCVGRVPRRFPDGLSPPGAATARPAQSQAHGASCGVRVLLDECLPRQLKRHLPGHQVSTVPEMGWAGIKNVRLT